MNYYHSVIVRDCLVGGAWKRRRDTCSGSLLGFVEWSDINAEIYYNIDEHRSNKAKGFDSAYASLSLKFTDRETSHKYARQYILIPDDAIRKITDICVKYIEEDPCTTNSILEWGVNHITAERDAEIVRLKALLDQHQIAY